MTKKNLTQIEKAFEAYKKATGEKDLQMNVSVQVWPKNGMYEETISVTGSNNGEGGTMQWLAQTRGVQAEPGNLKTKVQRVTEAADEFAMAIVKAFSVAEEE